MQLTWLDSNSWLIEINDKKILLDPWLVGSLTFNNWDWLFEGKKRNQQPIPDDIDLILLSQGIEDHSHPPTLAILDRNIPVVASPSASQVCEKLGYKKITSLNHEEIFILDNQVEIKAVKGSPLGPTLIENGYIFTDLSNQQRLYYEPHGFHSPSLKEEKPIDIIITPLTTLKIPFLGAVIQGQKTALDVCKLLNPKFILPTAAGGDIDYSGFLLNILKEEGTIEDFKNLLLNNQLNIEVIQPESGKKLTINN